MRIGFFGLEKTKVARPPFGPPLNLGFLKRASRDKFQRGEDDPHGNQEWHGWDIRSYTFCLLRATGWKRTLTKDNEVEGRT